MHLNWSFYLRACAFAVASVFFTLNNAWAQPASQNIADAKSVSSEIDATLSQYFKPNNPGATIVATRNGKTVFRKAYGMANLEHGIVMQPDMPMRLGSITKQFTAAAVLLLADQGKLKTSDDITKYLPDYPTHGARITIEHLLTHTSGIKNYTEISKVSTTSLADVTLAQVLDSFKNEPLDFRAGEHFYYSNSGYFLLGVIIEKVSGMRYEEFMDKSIFKPLHLTHTAYDCANCIVPRRVSGYTKGRDGYENTPLVNMDWAFSAGALRSNVDDLALWSAAISSGKLLKKESWQRMFAPYVLKDGNVSKYGYGWAFNEVRDSEVQEHGGRVSGFLTGVLRAPREDVFVAILTNDDGMSPLPQALAENVAGILLRK